MKTKSIGRPTKYKPEFVEQILEFFSLEKDSYRESVNNQGTVQMVPRRMPTLERFSYKIGVDPSTLRDWANSTNDENAPCYPEFSAAYARAKNCQMAYILEAGVVGALNGSFLNLFMKNAHGWSDKVEQETIHHGSIDLDQVNKDLEAAAIECEKNYQQMLADGTAGKYAT